MNVRREGIPGFRHTADPGGTIGTPGRQREEARIRAILRWLGLEEEGSDQSDREPGATSGDERSDADEPGPTRGWTDIGQEPVAVPPPPPVSRILALADEGDRSLQRGAGPSGKVRHHPIAGTALRWTVSLATGIGFGVLLTVHFSEGTAPGTAAIDTGQGERATVTLTDGSMVYLAPESQLRFPGSRHRTVALRGRAFVAVAEDPDRPFIVHTRSGTGRVLGTRFSLQDHDHASELLIVQGRMAVSTPRGRAEAGPGEMIRWGSGRAPAVEAVEKVDAHLRWMGRTLVFHGTTVEDVAREVGERYGKPVELADPSLAAFTVTGWFNQQDFEEVVVSICQVVGAECRITRDGATIGATPPPPKPGWGKHPSQRGGTP